jgi:hypothetical protein
MPLPFCLPSARMLDLKALDLRLPNFLRGKLEDRTSRVVLAGTIAVVTASGVLLLYKAAAADTSEVEIHTLEDFRQYAARGAMGRMIRALVDSTSLVVIRVTGMGEEIPELPRSLCLPSLRELDLSANTLGGLPRAIGGLKRLVRLVLQDNEIEELPEELCALSCLRELDVSRNLLRSLPDDLGKLTSLEVLNAMTNELEALPESIGSLQRLRRLGLKDNKLVALPLTVGGLTALEELFLTGNSLATLPKEMGRMASLVKLQASFNVLKTLPAELAELPRLELLRVACCELDALPETLTGARALAWLSIAGNPACRQPSPRRGVPEVALEEIQLDVKIGDGASGDVYEGLWNNRLVAVKIFRADVGPDGHCRDEVAIACAAAGHPGLARVLAIVKQPLGVVMELFPGAPLALKPNHESLLRCRWPAGAEFSLTDLLRVAIGVSAALEHLHYKGISHGDVYAHNVLLAALEAGAPNDGVLLCDYGAAFFYKKGGAVPHEGLEARGFGLLLRDMVQRLQIGFEGEQLLF